MAAKRKTRRAKNFCRAFAFPEHAKAFLKLQKPGESFPLDPLSATAIGIRRTKAPLGFALHPRVRFASPTMKGKALPLPAACAGLGAWPFIVPPWAADKSGAWIVVLPRYGEFAHATAPGAGSRHQAFAWRLSVGLRPRGPAVAERCPSLLFHAHTLPADRDWGTRTGARLSTPPRLQRRMFRFGRCRLQSHTGLIVPLLQSPLTSVVVNPSPQ